MQHLRLKKNEDRRLRSGHIWIYSNEVETSLKTFNPGQEVIVEAHDGTRLGVAYVNPRSLIAARLFSRDINESLTVDFFIKKIRLALNLRERLFNKPFYRLVFGDSDGLPGLVIDRFGDTFVLQLNTAGIDACRNIIIDALRDVFPTVKGILFRNDSSSRIQEGLNTEVVLAFGQPDSTIQLEENNVLFQAPLCEGQKTGWFYDHRLNRTRLADYVKDKRVLDVFSYLGAWGIQAAVLGAKEVFCLDSSPLSSKWIQTNAELNQLTDKIHVITEDAFVGLKNLAQNKEKFDVIILDPPAFAKKQKDKKEGLLAYQRLNELALKLLPTEGILFTCSCSMHVDQEEFLQTLRRAGIRTQCELQILERGHQAQDHPVHPAIPETDYLKMIIARKNQGR